MGYYRYRRRSYNNKNQPTVSGLLIVLFGLLFVSSFKTINFTKIISILFFLTLGIILIFILIKFFRKKKVEIPTSSVTENHTPSFVDRVKYPYEEKVENKYKLNQGLVTPTEEAFMKVLEEVVGDKYRIIPQVQLSRIMKPIDSNSHFTNYHDFNLIKAKSIDFVLYDKDLIHPYLAIELDDYSHNRADRIKRDEFVNRVMEEVGLRLIRIPVAQSYDLENLKTHLFI